MEDIILEIVKTTPVAAILFAWIYTERKQHQETRAFYRQLLIDCQHQVAKALEMHIQAEQPK